MAERSTRLMKILLLALAGIYLLNCLSPIRLHVDTLRYFAIKDCIELGCPPDSEAARDYFPYGYTALLLILSKLHLLHSAVIILFNCAYLFGGIWLAGKLPYFPKGMFLNAVSVLFGMKSTWLKSGKHTKLKRTVWRHTYWVPGGRPSKHRIVVAEQHTGWDE